MHEEWRPRYPRAPRFLESRSIPAYTSEQCYASPLALSVERHV